MSDDWTGLFAERLDAGRAIAFVSDERAGGIAVFLGTSRAEKNVDGRELAALDYESYTQMAETQLRELAATARERWPIVKLALLHRTGRVELTEPSVIVAVSSPHRGEAFESCRWLIDTLKEKIAIWKKEVWTDGSGTWKMPEE